MIELESSSPPTATHEASTVVVADDDSGFRTAVAEVLRENGLQVIEAADGTMLVGILRRAKFALVITDLAMPRLSGGDVIGMLRSSGDMTPFLVVTGVPDRIRDHASRWPRVSVIEKPVALEALLDAVRAALALPA